MPLNLDLTLQPFGAAEEAEPAVRWCAVCERYQPLEEFRPSKLGKFGRRSRCREVERLADAERKRERYATDPHYAEAQRARTSSPEYLAARRERDRERRRDPEYQAAEAERYRERRASPDFEDRTLPERRRRRRARMRDATVEEFTTADLYADWDERGMYACVVCGAPWAHVDHIQPLAAGGEHSVANLQPLCADHNLSKGARDPWEWLDDVIGLDVLERLQARSA